jgi:hypothetical protein
VRKCPKCGYILLGAVDHCTNCGAALTAASVGASPATATPGAAPPAAPPFVAPPSPFGPPPAPPSPYGAAPAPAPYANTPNPCAPIAWAPAPTPFDVKATPGRSPALRIAIAVLVALLVAGGGAKFLQHNDALPSGTSDFAKGNGIPYVAPDHSYTAQFPMSPAESSAQVPAGGYVLTMYMALDSNVNYEVGIAEAALPVAIPQGRVSDALDAGLQNAADGMKGSIKSKGTTTVDGFPAVEAHAKAGDGYQVRMLAIVTSHHIYILMVHSKTGADKLFDALKASFVMSESST